MSGDAPALRGPGCEQDHCLTCGDVAVPALILAVDGDRACALIDVEGAASGAREEIDVTLVEPVTAGDRVLVHARVAIARIEDEVDV